MTGEAFEEWFKSFNLENELTKFTQTNTPETPPIKHLLRLAFEAGYWESEEENRTIYSWCHPTGRDNW